MSSVLAQCPGISWLRTAHYSMPARTKRKPTCLPGISLFSSRNQRRKNHLSDTNWNMAGSWCTERFRFVCRIRPRNPRVKKIKQTTPHSCPLQVNCQLDSGLVHPTVYHRSSAGIGRTGVLILMETALCLIESNQSVCPLDIVRQMREQRLGMIQTAVSTKRPMSFPHLFSVL